MSWSIDVIGTKAAVRAKCEAEFTRAAVMYRGQEEEKDVLNAKERILATLDSVKDADWANGMKVTASGSRSDGYLSTQIAVTRQQLALDAPAAPAETAPAATPAT